MRVEFYFFEDEVEANGGKSKSVFLKKVRLIMQDCTSKDLEKWCGKT